MDQVTFSPLAAIDIAAGGQKLAASCFAFSMPWAFAFCVVSGGVRYSLFKKLLGDFSF
jgi:hypothetical protein